MNPSCPHPDLVEECQGLVRSLATTIHRKVPPYVQLDDLIAYGQVGLMEAARDFDATRGNRFSTYAYYRIRGAIYDGLSKMSWGNRVQYQQARYEQMAGEVLGEQGSPREHDAPREQDTQEKQNSPGEQVKESARSPTQSSSEADVRWFRDLSQSLAVVYLATRVSTPGDLASGELADTSQASPMVEAMDREMHSRLNDLINALPPDEGLLIRSTYFDGMTLQEAGERLGISRSWASRLHAKALQHLAHSLKLVGLAM